MEAFFVGSREQMHGKLRIADFGLGIRRTAWGGAVFVSWKRKKERINVGGKKSGHSIRVSKKNEWED